MNEEEKFLLIEQSHFEELVFHLSINENKIEAKKYLPKFNKKWIQSLLFNASDLFELKIFGDLFNLTGKCEIDIIEKDSFSDYLFLRGLIGNENKYSIDYNLLNPIEVYENPIQENILLSYIKNDDVSSFVDYITIHNFNIKNDEITVINLPFHLIDISAYLGSIDIFKYLILNGVEITENTIYSSILGGQEIIVEYLHTLGHSFDDCLSYAIWRHHNSLAKWLIENYHSDDMTLAECVFGFNTEMLLYFINNLNVDINSIDEYNKTALHWAVEHNDLNTVQFLLSKSIDINIKDFLGKTALDYATTNEMKELFN